MTVLFSDRAAAEQAWLLNRQGHPKNPNISWNMHHGSDSAVLPHLKQAVMKNNKVLLK